MALVLALGAASAQASQRLAIVVGNDAGQPFVPRLWFSVRDADRLTRTLEELGHFAPDDVITLRDQNVASIKAAFERSATKVRAQPNEPALIFFYYSGHANATGLEVGGETLSYTDLKALMASSPAQTKVAVLDACDSGSLTRVRGPRPVPLLTLGQEERAEGIVYISSTAIGEAAQESATLQGGFFTSHLNAALRGAADEDHDGHVTLSEAFRYSSLRTTEDTLKTESGPQHPTYTMNLAGRGEVVLTDLNAAESILVLPAAPQASYVVSGSTGLLQEIAGSNGPLQLALPAGRYQVERRRDASLEQNVVQLEPNTTVDLPEMKHARLVWTGLRGGRLPIHASLGGIIGPTVLGWGALSAGGVLSLSRPFGPIDLHLNLSFQAASIGAGDGRYTLFSGGVGVGTYWPVFYASPVLLEIGPEVGVGRIQQVRAHVLPAGSMDYSLGASALLTLWAGPGLRWGPYVSAMGHLYRIKDKWAASPLVTGGLNVGF